MYQQGTIGPLFLGGRRSGHVLPQKILKFQSPKMRFSAFWGLETKRTCFSLKKMQLSIYRSQSIPTSNEQMMETKLPTFTRKQLLHKETFKKRLKYSVHMTKAVRKTSGCLWKPIMILFHSDLMIHFFYSN